METGKIEFQGTQTSETKNLLRLYVLECEVALLKKEVASLRKAQPPTKKGK